jgi:hypothetical protein
MRDFQNFLPDLGWNSVLKIHTHNPAESLRIAGKPGGGSYSSCHGVNCGETRRRGGIPLVMVWTTLHLSVAIAIRYGMNGTKIESRCAARISAPVQAGPRVHPACYTMGTGSFPGAKRSGRGVYHPPPFVEVKERVELYYYPTYGSSCPVIGWTLPLRYLLHPVSPYINLLSSLLPPSSSVCAVNLRHPAE